MTEVGQIYAICCECDNEIRYVGLTCEQPLERRLYRHVRESLVKDDTHKQRWIRKHTLLGHTLQINTLEADIPVEVLASREQHWISLGPSLGWKLTNCHIGDWTPLSEETRKKMSEAKKGKPSNTLGKKHSEETKAKIAAANRGLKRSEETKRRMSEVQRGRKLSPEHIEKLSELHRGKTLSEEHKAKIGDAHKGMKRSETTRLNMRRSQHRRWHTDRNIVKPGCLFCEGELE